MTASETPVDTPRLIQFADFDRPYTASFVLWLKGVLLTARGHGWRVDLVLFESARSCEWAENLAAAGVTVHFAPESSRRSRLELRRWCEDLFGQHSGPTVIHSHFHGFDLGATLAARANPSVSVVWHVHSTFARSPSGIAKSFLKFRGLARDVDLIMCPSQNIVDESRRRVGRKVKVELLPSAIDTDSFALASEIEREQVRESLEVPPDRVVLLHFGWHWFLKGGDVFLETVRILVDAGRDVVALERGGAERYRRYARKLGIEDRLIVAPDIDDVRLLHAAADVLVCSSRREGMAYAVMEALCTGTPVVATAIPGHEYVSRWVAACRTTGHSPEELASELERLLDTDKAQLADERDDARRWVIETLDIDVVAQGLVETTYRSLVEAQGTRRG